MKMKSNFFNTLFVSSLFVILIGYGCSDDNSSEPTNVWSDNKAESQITWEEGVINFEKNDLIDLTDIDSVDFTFKFKTSSTKASQLEEGDIFVIGDFAICRVTNKATIGSSIIINSEPVPLTEAVKDADISWDYGVEFTEETTLSNLKKNGAEIQVIGERKYQFEFSIKSIKVIGEITFQEMETPVKITFEKSVADVSVGKLIIDGVFRRFRSKGDLKIRDKQLTEFNTKANDLSGEFTVTAIAAGSGEDYGIEIPFPLVAGPLGIPFFTWSIKFLGVINSYVPPGGSCLMSEKFTYSADQGFSYVPKNKTASATGNLKTSAIKEGEHKEKDQHTGGPGPVQVSWGIAVPRFEISFMGTTVGWFHTAFLLDGYYNTYPACQMMKAHFYGACGWGLGMLGVTVASGSKNLWDEKKLILKVGDCPE